MRPGLNCFSVEDFSRENYGFLRDYLEGGRGVVSSKTNQVTERSVADCTVHHFLGASVRIDYTHVEGDYRSGTLTVEIRREEEPVKVATHLREFIGGLVEDD